MHATSVPLVAEKIATGTSPNLGFEKLLSSPCIEFTNFSSAYIVKNSFIGLIAPQAAYKKKKIQP